MASLEDIHTVSVFRNWILKMPVLSKDEAIQKWRKLI
jgi:hypothetical protein